MLENSDCSSWNSYGHSVSPKAKRVRLTKWSQQHANKLLKHYLTIKLRAFLGSRPEFWTWHHILKHFMVFYFQKVKAIKPFFSEITIPFGYLPLQTHCYSNWKMHYQSKTSKYTKCSFLPLSDNNQEHISGAGQDPSAKQIPKVSCFIVLGMRRGKKSNYTWNAILCTL